MGGAEPIIIKGRQLLDQGEYLSATEILNKLIYVEVHNQEAKDLLADVYEQIGYQEESPSVRNSFLAAAYVLGNGFPSGVTEVGAFYWTVLAPDIVNSGREEQGSVSL